MTVWGPGKLIAAASLILRTNVGEGPTAEHAQEMQRLFRLGRHAFYVVSFRPGHVANPDRDWTARL